MTFRKRMLAFMLAGVFAVSLAVPVNADDIREMEKQKQKLEQQKKEAEADKNSLASQLNSIVADMKAAEQKMIEKETEIANAEEDLIAAKVTENTQYNGMKKRIKYMYENGGSGFIEILVAAKDVSDFLNKAEYITKISEYDRDMLKEFQKIVKQVEEKEAALKTEYEELGILQQDLTEKQAKVETLLKQKSAELASIDSEMGEVQKLIANAKEAERRRQEALAAQKPKPKPPSKPSGGNGGSGGGGSVISGNGFFTHPCPGMSYQSSYFGEVRHGIGDTRPHSGHDYAAPKGTPIYAAAAGRVVIAGYSNSAGYWVVIDHGKGITTKYMHMYTDPYVSAGQQVSKGQNIGGVGTTGQSTGNHLHFQVELNGRPVNPDNYF